MQNVVHRDLVCVMIQAHPLSSLASSPLLHRLSNCYPRYRNLKIFCLDLTVTSDLWTLELQRSLNNLDCTRFVELQSIWHPKSSCARSMAKSSNSLLELPVCLFVACCCWSLTTDRFAEWIGGHSDAFCMKHTVGGHHSWLTRWAASTARFSLPSIRGLPSLANTMHQWSQHTRFQRLPKTCVRDCSSLIRCDVSVVQKCSHTHISRASTLLNFRPYDPPSWWLPNCLLTKSGRYV